ncbi:MAG TPA: radical SAM protein [Candidatus Wunengus sp. YC61]|uniref:radical SAM protein n=1 Tax=Candidatus Wunengus sp. YC61 TaxID=3367698 RepID=UPI0040265C70
MDTKVTSSICPVCYEVIPAAIVPHEGMAVMVKSCPIHGEFKGIVERDIKWFDLCQSFKSTNIYYGYIIDPTDRCNIKCKYCYHDNKETEMTVEEVISEAETHKDLAPFFLAGGGPTMHENLPQIIRGLSAIAETWLLTNGIKLCEEEYLDCLCDSGLLVDNRMLYVGLSFHKESLGKDIEFLELCRRKNLVVGTTFYVIDDVSQIADALTIYQEFKDVIGNMRIKSATNLWVGKGMQNHIFISDMIGYLNRYNNTELIHDGAQFQTKVSYANVRFEDMFLILVSWYDKNNIDLNDINCPPYYKAKDGGIYNFVTAALKNEGINRYENITVRKARHEDIRFVAPLWKDMILETTQNTAPRVDWWEIETTKLMDIPTYHLFVVEQYNKIVGFSDGFMHNDASRGEIIQIGRHLYVSPEYRGTKATALLHKSNIRAGKKLGGNVFTSLVPYDKQDYWTKKGYVPTDILMEIRR